jgi:PAS domain S-box-containing protein
MSATDPMEPFPMELAAKNSDDGWQGRTLRLVMQPFALAVSQSAIPTFMVDIADDGLPIVFANQSFLRLTGWGEDEVLGRNMEVLHADPAAADRVAARAAAGEVVSAEVLLNRKDGTTFSAALDIAPTFDASGRPTMLFATILDISDRVEAMRGLAAVQERFEERVAERTAALESALERTELLSREITHRTKNALALLGAIIAAKGRRARSPQEAELLADIAGRVRAIGGLQGLLDGVECEENGIDLAEFLEQLVRDLDRPTEARVMMTEAPHAELPAQAALAVALCVTELVLNAQKHGYPDGRQGTIMVAALSDGGRVTVTVEDNGVGLPDGFDPAAGEGLGMLVLLDQTAKLLGHLSFGRCAAGGARFEITFPA